jgi:hypothetical protein
MMAGTAVAALADGIAVAPDTYIRAETDVAFADFQRRAGGKVNTNAFVRQPTLLTDQVAHRLTRIVRYPDARQFAGPVQFGQHDRVAPIRLHTIARLHGNERRGHHDAIVAELSELPMEAVAAGPCLIAKAQLPSALA